MRGRLVQCREQAAQPRPGVGEHGGRHGQGTAQFGRVKVSCTTAWQAAGSVQPNVGPLPALVPASSTTSAWAGAAAAAEVCMLPSSPTDSEWSSAIAPLPDNVVPTAADRASASAVSSVPAPSAALPRRPG